MMKLALKILAVFLFVDVVDSASACSCRTDFSDSKFCSLDFLIVAGVTHERHHTLPEGSVTDYGLQIFSTIKSSPRYKDADKVVEVKVSGEPCTVELSIGRKYVLAGRVREAMVKGKTGSVLEVEPCNYARSEFVDQKKFPTCGKRQKWNNPFLCFPSSWHKCF